MAKLSNPPRTFCHRPRSVAPRFAFTGGDPPISRVSLMMTLRLHWRMPRRSISHTAISNRGQNGRDASQIVLVRHRDCFENGAYEPDKTRQPCTQAARAHEDQAAVELWLSPAMQVRHPLTIGIAPKPRCAEIHESPRGDQRHWAHGGKPYEMHPWRASAFAARGQSSKWLTLRSSTDERPADADLVVSGLVSPKQTAHGASRR